MSNIYVFDNYGGIADGSTDNVSVWKAIINEIGSQPAAIVFGAGHYYFSEQLQMDLIKGQQITVKGYGKGTTQLRWINGSQDIGMKFMFNDNNTSWGAQCRFNISDLTFFVDQIAGTAIGKNALEIRNNFSKENEVSGYLSLNNVMFAGGADNNNWGGWNYNLILVGLSINNVMDCDFFGSADTNSVFLSGGNSDPTLYSIVTNFTNCYFVGGSAGLIYGDNVQGVTVNQCNFTNCRYGVAVNAKNADQLIISNSQFDCIDCAVILPKGMNHFIFSNNLVYMSRESTFGIYNIQCVYQYIISNNNFNGIQKDNHNNTAISMSGYCLSLIDNGNVIMGNTFNQLTTAISLDNTTRDWKVLGNSFSNNNTNISNLSDKNSIIE